MNNYLRLLAIFIAIISAACTTNETVCPDYQTPKLQIAFFQSDSDTANFMGVRILNTETYLNDSSELNDTIYYNIDFPSLIQIPLNNATDAIALVFDLFHVEVTDSTITPLIEKFDTLFLKYNSNVILKDLDCDFYMEYLITDTLCSRNEIDSIAFTNKDINADSETNVEIYF
ncbi:MAG: hypothetical protein JEZ09_20460 [Salinivirgaceae bacterium]|nr:hypothetical protein [Salinivirgaceae bacterium]